MKETDIDVNNEKEEELTSAADDAFGDFGQFDAPASDDKNEDEKPNDEKDDKLDENEMVEKDEEAAIEAVEDFGQFDAPKKDDSINE